MAIELTDDVRREIGQHFVFGFHGQDVSEDIKTLITEYYVGNVILMKRNVRDIEQVHDLVKRLQLLARDAGHAQPLMIGIDQENGLVSAFTTSTCGTQFPGAMTLAATGSVELAEQVASASAQELKTAGINWVYSPVADVNSDPRNPVIGVRSFGDDPAEVSKFVGAVSDALTKNGIAPSPKHFPGHGNTHVDSHLSLPRIMCSKDELAAVELVPFKTAINKDVATVMTGHMALPVITGDDTPCSLSRKITTGLLRDELKYRGVVVTDCLEMEAVAEKYGSEDGAVMALQAGADIVMICHTMKRQKGAIEATYAAVREGRLSLDDFRTSGKRIAALKVAFTQRDVDFSDAKTLDMHRWAALREQNVLLSRHVYASAMTVLRDPAGVLPLHGRAKRGLVVVFTPRMESINLAVDDPEGVLRDGEGHLRNTAGPSYYAFAAAVAERVPTQHIVYAPETELSLIERQCLPSASAVVFALRNAFGSGEWQLKCLRHVVEWIGSRPLVVVSTCAPYDVLGLKETGPAVPDAAVCATMEFTVPAMEAMAQVIFGEVEAKGAVPVHLGRK